MQFYRKARRAGSWVVFVLKQCSIAVLKCIKNMPNTASALNVSALYKVHICVSSHFNSITQAQCKLQWHPDTLCSCDFFSWSFFFLYKWKHLLQRPILRICSESFELWPREHGPQTLQHSTFTRLATMSLLTLTDLIAPYFCEESLI